MYNKDMLQEFIQNIYPGSNLNKAKVLGGGTSANVTLLILQNAQGQEIRIVNRLHGPKDRKDNPTVATTEFKVLKILYEAGLNVPPPISIDQTNCFLGAPSVTVGFLEGVVNLKPLNPKDYVKKIGIELAKLHSVDLISPRISFLRNLKNHCNSIFGPKYLGRTNHILDFLKPYWPSAVRNPSVILHGDFWPGNLLWMNENIVGIIDWEDTLWGDPILDLANARFEIYFLLGKKLMDFFTKKYLEYNPIDILFLPWWDLYTAFQFCDKIHMFSNDERPLSQIQEDFENLVKINQRKIQDLHSPRKDQKPLA